MAEKRRPTAGGVFLCQGGLRLPLPLPFQNTVVKEVVVKVNLSFHIRLLVHSPLHTVGHQVIAGGGVHVGDEVDVHVLPQLSSRLLPLQNLPVVGLVAAGQAERDIVDDFLGKAVASQQKRVLCSV